MKYAPISVNIIRRHIDVEKYINNIIRRYETESECPTHKYNWNKEMI